MDATAVHDATMALRLVSATVLVLLSVALFRGGAGNRAYYTASLLACCITGYLLVPVLPQNPVFMPFIVVAAGLAALAPVALWACAGTVFDDHFIVPAWAYPVSAITVAIGVAALLVGSAPLADWLDWAAMVVWLGWLGLALAAILHDRDGDLVEARRRLRYVLAALVIVLSALTIWARISMPSQGSPLMDLANVVVILVVSLALAAHLLTLRPNNLFTRISARHGVSQQQLSPLAHRLQACMEEERLHATRGLTLDMLADRLDIQPQRLRHVIHHELGHRSFGAFVNLYRVKEVASRLAEPENHDTPLMTIARDAGFSSMTPLNRTFRARYKISPSAYRDKVQGG
jgi:AraC-like DNA-binding protein